MQQHLVRFPGIPFGFGALYQQTCRLKICGSEVGVIFGWRVERCLFWNARSLGSLFSQKMNMNLSVPILCHI
jgi:hypothetical protein